MSILSKTIYRFNIIPNDIFKGNIKHNPKIHVEPQKIPNSQSNLEKKEQSWRYYAPWLQTILNVCVCLCVCVCVCVCAQSSVVSNSF